MGYLLHILVLVGIYTILAASLDLLVGHTGLLSLAQTAFYGLGAYSSALMAVDFGAPFIAGVGIGMLTATSFSFIVSLSSARLREDYFAIATLGFQAILFIILKNWIGLTRGPLGITGIPRPVVFGWTIQSQPGFLGLTWAFAFLVYLAVGILTRSPYGRVLRAIRDDEVLSQALGKNTLRFKVSVFLLSSAMAASAGSLYAHYINYVDPTSFTVMESILVLSIVIIGGAGSTWGPLIGATVLVTLPEIFRFVGLPSSVAANIRQILYGGALIVFMMFRPRGLLGEYCFGRGKTLG